MKIIVGCSGANEIAKKVAARLKLLYTPLLIKYFPDGEMKIRFPEQIKGKAVFLVQSFYGKVNEKILETLFATYTAKDLGAKKIILLATYFPYFRQDKRFKARESISLDIIKEIFSQAPLSRILIVEPHLHRKKKLKFIFSNGKRISVIKNLAEFIKKRIRGNYVIVGPDEESQQWVMPLAKKLKKEYFVLKKKRFTAHKVRIVSKILRHHVNSAVVVDDICSTGGTLLEAVRILKKEYKKIYLIPIHGIFVAETLNKLKKVATVFSTNSIPSKAARIDISPAIAEAIK